MTHFEAAKVASFNPRAHAGRDRRRPIRRGWPSTSFNPRAHAGRDIPRCAAARSGGGFNPRAHAGRDQRNRFDRSSEENVSTHAPTRGATRRQVHAGRQQRRVSTHAPTRGATAQPDQVRQDYLFQPTRPRGARPPYAKKAVYVLEFQPTRPRGARPAGPRLRASLQGVSTHAPTRGATSAL